MEFYEAITNLNILSSYDTELEKREKYKECINAILENHNQLDSAIKDNNIIIEKLMCVNEKINKRNEYYEILVRNIIDKLQDNEKPNIVIQYAINQLDEIIRG